MAVKASITFTISKYRDCDSITRYFRLQASTAAAPAIPTTLTPSSSDWSTTEPTYTSGSTNTLYYTDKYVFSDGTFQYTDDGNGKAIKSSSYEAAKEAYNKAQAAQDTAETTQENLDNLEIGGRNLIEKTNQGILYWDTSIGSKYKSLTKEEVNWLGTRAVKYTSHGINDETSSSNWAVLQFKDPNGQNKLKTSSYYVISFDASFPSAISTIRFCKSNGTEQMLNQNVSVIKNEERTDENGDIYYHYEVLCYTKNNFDDHISDDSYFYMSIVALASETDAVAKYANLKMEIGNKATDWTPAPEDIQSELNTSLTDLNTSINDRIDDAEDMINDLSDVVDTKIDSDDANLIAQNKLDSFLDSAAWLRVAALEGAIQALTNSDDGTYQILEQADGEWSFQLGKLFTDVKTAVEDLTKTKNQLDGDAESKLSKRIDDLDEGTKYIKMTSYNDQPAIILGMNDNPFQVRITNTAMEFVENGNVIAYVNNGAFYNTVGIVREEIKIVNNNQGFSWKTRANGNLGLQWVEET